MDKEKVNCVQGNVYIIKWLCVLGWVRYVCKHSSICQCQSQVIDS